MVLRNPSDHEQEFSLDVNKAFELPANAPQHYRARSSWAADRALAQLALRAGHAERIVLKPFQVLTLDAVPTN